MVGTRCKSRRRGLDRLVLGDPVQLSRETTNVSSGVVNLTICVLTIWIMASLSRARYGRMKGVVPVLMSMRAGLEVLRSLC